MFLSNIALAQPASTPLSFPNMDPGFYNLIPELILVLLVIVVAIRSRRSLKSAFDALVMRIRSGAAIQFGSFRLDGLRISRTSLTTSEGITSRRAKDWKKYRDAVYTRTNKTFIAAQLFPSDDPNQIYDILIYIVRHKEKISDISYVEYYFGSAWNHKAFISRDVRKRFAVVASAYAPFLCFARVHFRDETHIDTWRYVDFHTGMLPFSEETVNVRKDSE